MNSIFFGKECQCGNVESDHVPIKPTISIPETNDSGIFLPYPPNLDKKRGACKVCNYINFKSKKKN